MINPKKITSLKIIILNQGFTLVELIITIAIIAVLAAISIPAYGDYVERAHEAQAINDISTMSVEIEHYFQENRRYPDSLAEVGFSAKLDPWGVNYQYLNLTNLNGGQPRRRKNLKPLNSDFDLYSKGKDKKSVPALLASISDDDIVRALDGKFIDKAIKF